MSPPLCVSVLKTPSGFGKIRLTQYPPLKVLHLNLEKKVVICLPTVVSKDNESFDYLLKRFKKKCEKAAILSEIKKRQAYEKPSVRRKREDNASKRKMLKIQRRMQRYMR